MNKGIKKSRVAGLVVTRQYKDNWLARALRASGTVIDSSARVGRENAVANLCSFIFMKPSDFSEQKITENEYHYVLRGE